MQYKINDESGDKDFFTIIPNYIANHSTANDQSLYFQMKKYAGESGKCFATEQTLMKKMKIGKKAFDKSLDYLLKQKWVTFVGLTQGKTRPIKTYKINNIWQQNSNYYKEISTESNVSFQKDKSPKLEDKSPKQHKISAESNVEEEPYKEEPKEDIAEVDLVEVIPELLKDKQRHIQIIGLWAKAKRIEFTSKEHQSSFIRRNLRAARDLVAYPDEKIIETMQYLILNADFKIVLSTVGKYIDEDLHSLALKKTKTLEI